MTFARFCRVYFQFVSLILHTIYNFPRNNASFRLPHHYTTSRTRARAEDD